MDRLVHGIVPPLVTPLDSHGALDRPALLRLVARVLDAGLHGVFLLGTTGESPSLNSQLKREVLREGCAAVAGRVPVLAGVTSSSLEETIALSLVAADAGADVIVLTAPFYFAISQDELFNWCRRVIDISPLPVMLYNMPGNTKVPIEPRTLRRFVPERRVIGIKDSSGDFECLRQYLEIACADRPDWSVMTGPEEFTVETLQLGGAGGTAGGAMLWPEQWARVYELATAGAWGEARALGGRLSEQLSQVFNSVSGDGCVPKTIKAALSSLGVCQEYPAPPLACCPPETKARIAEIVAAEVPDPSSA